MRKDGFTLIELMIVVAIIAIIAAIAVPNLLTSKMSANEANGQATLRTLMAAEAAWRQQDSDANGILDFWTYDVSCLYRMLRSDGISPVEAIDISIAKADFYPAAQAVLGATVVNIDETDAAQWTTGPKGGYRFAVITNDPTGAAYCQNDINRPAILSGNLTGNDFLFAFSAAPQVYAASGVRIYIINQTGTVYGVDPAGDTAVLKYGTIGNAGGTQGGNAGDNMWPALDPTIVDKSGGGGSPRWSMRGTE